MTGERPQESNAPSEFPGGCAPLAPYGLVGIPLHLARVLAVNREVVRRRRILALQHQPAEAGYAG